MEAIRNESKMIMKNFKRWATVNLLVQFIIIVIGLIYISYDYYEYRGIYLIFLVPLAIDLLWYICEIVRYYRLKKISKDKILIVRFRMILSVQTVAVLFPVLSYIDSFV